MLLAPIIVASASAVRASLSWLVVYVLTVLVMQIIIDRFLCTHCPHYCRDEPRLHCLSLWNTRKMFTARAGSWHLGDTIVLSLALAILVLFPVYWIMRDIVLPIVYLISLIKFMSTLRRYECSRCIYFGCPANSVPEAVKKNFTCLVTVRSDRDTPGRIK